MEILSGAIAAVAIFAALLVSDWLRRCNERAEERWTVADGQQCRNCGRLVDVANGIFVLHRVRRSGGECLGSYLKPDEVPEPQLTFTQRFPTLMAIADDHRPVMQVIAEEESRDAG